jgi:hypothetical protein
MSACALFEIDTRYGTSGKSVLLGEQVRETPGGWPVWGVPQLLYSDIAVLALGMTGVGPSIAARASRQRQNLLARANGGLTVTEVCEPARDRRTPSRPLTRDQLSARSSRFQWKLALSGLPIRGEGGHAWPERSDF